MKILTKEEEEAHYNATLKGGITGGFAGLALGGAAVFGASKRFQGFRQLTIPMRTFLVTSAGTFSAIISADRASRKYEWDRDPTRKYKDKTAVALEEAQQTESNMQRLKDWGRENRYSIVGASWVASMGIALGLVGRDKYLTTAQKLVQARVYAQGLTLAVLIVTAIFETKDASQGKGHWETVKVLDPNDPEHKHMIEQKIHHESYAGEDLWRDMVEAEERRIEERKSHQQAQSKSESNTQAKGTEEAQSKPKPNTQAKGTEEAQSKPKPNTQAKGTEAKNKIAHESKSAGKVDRAEGEKIEEANMARQNEKEGDMHQHATADTAKVKDRGGYGGK
eukprot:GHVU01215094.1.p1 GENE.GHVU01215094.1~~GHVU01215094.1.p1  ORF type:complete len:336 (-),score=57.64 GHVU01215094.1:163-1170(-)